MIKTPPRFRRLLIIISLFVLIALCMVILSYFGNKIIIGSQGYIAGEGLWSKAQKQAVLELIEYTATHNQENLERFYEHLGVTDGDKQARITLSSDTPDKELARQGFLQGGLMPEEIEPMIWLFINFQNVAFMREAISYWEQADVLIVELKDVAAELERVVSSGELSETHLLNFLQQLFLLDNKLTILEQNFSSTIRESSYRIARLIHLITVFFMITVIAAGGYVSSKFYWDINTLNEQLSEAEQKFRNVLEHSTDVIYQMDIEASKYFYMSPSIFELTGYTADEVLDLGPQFIFDKIHPDDQKNLSRNLSTFSPEKLQHLFKHPYEFRLKNRNGQYTWISIRSSLILNDDGSVGAIVGNVRDISDRKCFEEQLSKSLREKETLLAEVHHRVKNNLAVISSLIELQKDEDDSINESFQEIQSRIKSIALVHEKLYQSESFAEIVLSDYIRDLIGILSRTYNSDQKPITVHKELSAITLKLERAIPVGLIFNELISNVFKHAYSDMESGELNVILEEENGKVRLIVGDNGCGLPEGFDYQQSNSLGMTLIHTLSSQIEAELEINSKKGSGTSISVVFDAE